MLDGIPFFLLFGFFFPFLLGIFSGRFLVFDKFLISLIEPPVFLHLLRKALFR